MAVPESHARKLSLEDSLVTRHPLKVLQNPQVSCEGYPAVESLYGGFAEVAAAKQYRAQISPSAAHRMPS